MGLVVGKPELYIYVQGATHFLTWELPEFAKYFTLVNQPSEKVPLLCFGPDALESASRLPASKRFAVLFPGFGHNPLYNPEIKKLHHKLIKGYFEAIFINPGPLEIAYKDLKNVYFYPFSVDTTLISVKKYRTSLDSLIHVSNNGLQKDWERSERIMQLTGLRHEVYPPRDDKVLQAHQKRNELKNKIRRSVLLPAKKYLPLGYVSHEMVIKKYQQYDGFVHIARDIKNRVLIDGKYTASLIEAGVTGSILFWHDTLQLGNTLETVFSLPLDEQQAADEIMQIRKSIDVERHSKRTREEMLETFNPQKSVGMRATQILELL